MTYNFSYKLLQNISLIILSVFLFVSCTNTPINNSAEEVERVEEVISPQIDLSEGIGGFTGNIQFLNTKELNDTFVYLAKIQYIEDGGYYYFIDTANLVESSIGKNGDFTITHEPDDYAVLFGELPEFARPILNEDNEPKIFSMIGNELVIIGNHEIELP